MGFIYTPGFITYQRTKEASDLRIEAVLHHLIFAMLCKQLQTVETQP